MGGGLMTTDGGRGCLSMIAFVAGAALIVVSAGCALFWGIGLLVGGLSLLAICAFFALVGAGLVYFVLK
jgi:hypothetical protein